MEDGFKITTNKMKNKIKDIDKIPYNRIKGRKSKWIACRLNKLVIVFFYIFNRVFLKIGNICYIGEDPVAISSQKWI